MNRVRILAALAVLGAAAAGLAALRDPPWLGNITSGFGDWQTDASGVKFRWIAGHASFFIPADARAFTMPLRCPFDTLADWPVAATITIDDRSGDRLVFTDTAWRRVTLELPPPGSRRFRRIDIRVDRTPDGEHGLQLGEVTWR